jgi:hypothetical protein
MANNKPYVKSPRKVVEARVEKIAQMLANRVTKTSLRDHIKTLGWGVGRCQIDRYIERAEELLLKDITACSHKLKAQILHACQQLHVKCLTSDDNTNALNCLRFEAQLAGLMPGREGSEDKPNISVNILNVIEEVIDGKRQPPSLTEVPINGHAIPAITDAAPAPNTDQVAPEAGRLSGQ